MMLIALLLLGLPTEVVRVADADWRVLELRDLGQRAKSNNIFQGDAVTTGRFVAVGFDLTSRLNQPDRIYRQPRIRDERGRVFDHVDHEPFYVPAGALTLSGVPLPPGVTKRFWSVYEVAQDASSFFFEGRSMSAFPDVVWIPLGEPTTKAKAKSHPASDSSRLYHMLMDPRVDKPEPPRIETRPPLRDINRYAGERWRHLSRAARLANARSLSWEEVDSLPASEMLSEEMARWSELSAHRRGSN